LEVSEYLLNSRLNHLSLLEPSDNCYTDSSFISLRQIIVTGRGNESSKAGVYH
jgi:hypothetical protein